MALLRPNILVALMTLGLVLGAGRAHAQEAARSAREVEQAALEAEARLDYDAAFELYKKALDATGKPAFAEVVVFKLQFLAEKTSRWKELGELLEVLLRRDGKRRLDVPPLLQARCAYYAARARLAAGDIEGAERAVSGLGFVQRFAVAGPFDNERGGGFDTAYEPEKGPIDLAARYPGKGREVGWSFPARDAFLGRLDLDAMLRPNDEALAYALTYVKWEGEPRAVALRIGSDEGVKVWWNQELVISRDVNRAVELDQDAAAVVLQPGWNRLLLKVTERKGSWELTARITELDGTPLEKPLAVEPRVAADELKKQAAPAKPVPEEAKKALALGAIDEYLALEKSGKATAHDFFHLGYLHYRRKAHDENDHPDREAFKRAVALEDKNPVYHVYLSFVSAATGEFSVNREENARRAELERAHELDPKQARAALVLADYYFRSLRNVEKAEAHLARALETAPRAVDARLLETEIAERRGWGGLARALIVKLAEDEAARRWPSVLMRRASVARAQGDLAAAEQALAAALQVDFAHSGARDQLVEVRKARGDVAGALAGLADRGRLHPFDVANRLERAKLLVGAERLEEAAKVLEEALAISPQDDVALAEHGRVMLRLGRRPAALEDFGRALTLNPNLPDLRRYVEFLKEEEKPFEAEHRLDPMEAVAAAKDIPLDKEVPARTLLENVVTKVNLDGTSSEFEQQVFRIENDDGVEGYDWYGVTYAVGEQKATIRRATVVKKDGRLEEARIDNVSAPRGEGEFATYSRRHVDLPPLEVGDVVVIESRVDDLRQSFFGDYFGKIQYFQGFAPIERIRYTLIAPAGRELYFHSRKMDIEPQKRASPDGATVTWTWERKKVAKIEREPNMPPFEEVAPCLQVSTFKDWSAFSRWYWNLVRKQFELSDEMRAKIAELVKGKTTREEKIRAIYNFVVTDVRYNDKWEFGVHGFKPYNASSIFTRRFGDCKDKATLIITMLSALDIPAFPVLIEGVDARGEEDYSLPLMNHFNHCIAYAPGPSPDGTEGWFLDGTAQHHEATNLPNMDWGATVLIVKPDGGELKKVRWPDALRENGIKESHRVALREDGGGVIAADIAPGGTYGVVVRNRFQNPGERKEQLEKIYGRHFAGARVLEESFSDLRNLDEPVRVRFRLEVPKLVKQQAGGFAVDEVPSVLFEWIFAEDMSDFATKADRKYDVVLPVPSGVEETIEYELPEGFTLKQAPEEVKVESEFGDYVKRYETQGKTLRVTRRLVVRTQRVPVEKYQAWRDWANRIDHADDERAILGKGGGPQE